VLICASILWKDKEFKIFQTIKIEHARYESQKPCITPAAKSDSLRNRKNVKIINQAAALHMVLLSTTL